jgi:hypothetical protein
METQQIIETIIINFPNFAGLVVAIYVLYRQNKVLWERNQQLIDTCITRIKIADNASHKDSTDDT